MAFLNARIFAVLGWFGVAVLVAFGAVAILNGHWLRLIQLALFLAGAAYLMVLDGVLPPLLKFTIVFAALINASGWMWNQYVDIVWYDEVAHFYTSFAVTLVLAFLIYRRAESYLSRHHLDFLLVVVSFGVAAGALWEVIEWAILVGKFKDSPASDIVYDSLGAVLAAGLSVWFARRSAFRVRTAPDARGRA